MTDRPMQEPTLLLLTALSDQPRHGYGIVQEVLAISGGRVKLRTGTLYAALQRLVDEGLIEVHHEEIVDGRARRSYALTGGGRVRLAAEAERLEATAREARRRLSLADRSGFGPAPKGATA
ncbi:PadR family transcriptional regulator [Streptomyces olivoreticuli]|uniref:PadR family transcriptional regulator n=1 Tax=Streptomyces olivoreticuli TaxID=68246 RepID=UPI000E258B5C|nr:PadR family transcriptional regulator [Streptomyces olivoreticuli]